MIVDADDTITRQSLLRMTVYFSADTDMVIANVAKYVAGADEPSLYMKSAAVE